MTARATRDPGTTCSARSAALLSSRPHKVDHPSPKLAHRACPLDEAATSEQAAGRANISQRLAEMRGRSNEPSSVFIPMLDFGAVDIGQQFLPTADGR